MTSADDLRVSYPLKELIDGINRKLDTVLEALHAKADAAEVQELRARLAELETTVAALTAQEAVQERHEERTVQRRRWAVDAGVGLLLVAATIALTLATMH